MSHSPSKHLPSYRLHRQSGQAVVTLTDNLGGRRDILLGKYDTPESRTKYAHTIAEWEVRGRQLVAPAQAESFSVNELLLAYLQWAEKTYRDGDGNPTREVENLKDAIRPLRKLYGLTEAAKFGPLALRTVRQDMIASGLCRRTINTRIGRLKRVFRWAASYEMLPAAVYEALRSVPGLDRGRSEARDTEPVKPVAEEDVKATLPHMPPGIAAVVQLQLLTGCRVSEALTMRGCDLNTSGAVWIYRPARHKNKNRGIDRTIHLGPQAQAVVKPFLTTDLQAYLFAPAAAIKARDARRAAQRKTKPTPSALKRKALRLRRKAKRCPRERYDRNSYRQAVQRAAWKATQARVLALLKSLADENRLILPQDLASKDLFRKPNLLTEERARIIAALNNLDAEVERLRVRPWSPLQLRHTAATLLRARYGIEAAKVILGHTRVETSQIYAEKDMHKAMEIMREIG